jgi:hypothetical protein
MRVFSNFIFLFLLFTFFYIYNSFTVCNFELAFYNMFYVISFKVANPFLICNIFLLTSFILVYYL